MPIITSVRNVQILHGEVEELGINDGSIRHQHFRAISTTNEWFLHEFHRTRVVAEYNYR